jgi:hypothetical protein
LNQREIESKFSSETKSNFIIEEQFRHLLTEMCEQIQVLQFENTNLNLSIKQQLTNQQQIEGQKKNIYKFINIYYMFTLSFCL